MIWHSCNLPHRPVTRKTTLIYGNECEFYLRFVICRNHILPICLPNEEIDLTGRTGIIAGWGKTDLTSGRTGTAVLQAATVPIIGKPAYFNSDEKSQLKHHFGFQAEANASNGIEGRRFSLNCTRKCSVPDIRMASKMRA